MLSMQCMYTLEDDEVEYNLTFYLTSLTHITYTGQTPPHKIQTSCWFHKKKSTAQSHNTNLQTEEHVQMPELHIINTWIQYKNMVDQDSNHHGGRLHWLISEHAPNRSWWCTFLVHIIIHSSNSPNTNHIIILKCKQVL